jgi:hypothetical protein
LGETRQIWGGTNTWSGETLTLQGERVINKRTRTVKVLNSACFLLHKEIKINNKKMDENPSSYFMEKSVNIKE